MSFWRELRRRNVFKVGAAYAMVAWLLMQLTSYLAPSLLLPPWTATFVTVILGVGFPVALLLAWAYEVTPGGIERTKPIPLASRVSELKGQKLNYLVTALLVVVVGFMAVDDYLPRVAGGEAEALIESKDAADRVSFILEAPETTRFTLAMAVPFPALSADGRKLAFVAARSAEPGRTPAASSWVVWVQTLGELQAQPLENSTGASEPFWSPDGRFIGYLASGGRLERIAATGDGAPQTLASNAVPFGGTWSPDGTIVYVGADGLYAVSEDGGEPERLTSIDTAHGETSYSHRYPVMLPDGRRFLYLALNRQRSEQGLYVGSLDDPELKQRVVATDTNGALGTGSDGREYLFYVRDFKLIAQPFNLTSAKLVGQPTVVAQPMEPAQSMRFAPFTVAGTTVVYRPRFDPRARLVWVDRHGVHGEAVPARGLGYGYVALSPDATRLAATRVDTQTNTAQVWWFDLERAVEERLTASPGGGYFPLWTTDGARVIYASPRAAVWNMYSRPVVGADSEAPLLAGPIPPVKYPRDITRDGRYLVFQGDSNGTGADLWVLPLTGDGQARRLIATPGDDTTANVSPNGRWIAYTSNEAGERQIYVSTFPDATGARRISTAGGSDPKWRADGRELYYVSPDDVLMAVDVAESETFEPGTPEPLFRFEPNPLALEFGSVYAPAPDGRRFLISELMDSAQPQLVVTLNWRPN